MEDMEIDEQPQCSSTVHLSANLSHQSQNDTISIVRKLEKNPSIINKVDVSIRKTQQVTDNDKNLGTNAQPQKSLKVFKSSEISRKMHFDIIRITRKLEKNPSIFNKVDAFIENLIVQESESLPSQVNPRILSNAEKSDERSSQKRSAESKILPKEMPESQRKSIRISRQVTDNVKNLGTEQQPQNSSPVLLSANQSHQIRNDIISIIKKLRKNPSIINNVGAFIDHLIEQENKSLHLQVNPRTLSNAEKSDEQSSQKRIAESKILPKKMPESQRKSKRISQQVTDNVNNPETVEEQSNHENANTHNVLSTKRDTEQNNDVGIKDSSKGCGKRGKIASSAQPHLKQIRLAPSAAGSSSKNNEPALDDISHNNKIRIKNVFLPDYLEGYASVTKSVRQISAQGIYDAIIARNTFLTQPRAGLITEKKEIAIFNSSRGNLSAYRQEINDFVTEISRDEISRQIQRELAFLAVNNSYEHLVYHFNTLLERPLRRMHSSVAGDVFFDSHLAINVGIRYCTRCNQTYAVNNKDKFGCRFHRRAGNLRPCQCDEYAIGCIRLPEHSPKTTIFDNLTDSARSEAVCECKKIFAFDCEFVDTQWGFEVAQLLVVNYEGKLVYQSYCKPAGIIYDCLTEYSGITPEKLTNVRKTFDDIKTEINEFLNADAILIGHGHAIWGTQARDKLVDLCLLNGEGIGQFGTELNTATLERLYKVHAPSCPNKQI